MGDYDLQQLFAEVWSKYKFLTVFVCAYTALMAAVWWHLDRNLSDSVILRVQLSTDRVRSLLIWARDLIRGTLRSGGLAIAISVFILFIAIIFDQPGLQTNAILVQAASFLPPSLLAVTQLIANFRGIQRLCRNLNGDI